MKVLLEALAEAEKKLLTAEAGLSEIDIGQFKNLVPTFTELHQRITTCHRDIESAKLQIFKGLGSMVESSLGTFGTVRTSVHGVTIRKDGVWRGSVFYKFSGCEIAKSGSSKDYFSVCQALIEYLSKATPERSASLEQSVSDFVKISALVDSLVEKGMQN